MANGKLGSQAGWSNDYVANLDSTRQLTPSDSGKVFFLDTDSGAFTINLPKLSSKIAGWNCKFIIDVDGTDAVSIVAYGLPIGGGTTATSADAESVSYQEFARDGLTGGTVQDCDGYTIGGSAVLGNTYYMHTNGSQWFMRTMIGAHAQGGNIDTD